MPKETPATNRPAKGRKTAPSKRAASRKTASAIRRSPTKIFFAWFSLILIAGVSLLGGSLYRQVRQSKSLPQYITSLIPQQTPADVFPGQQAINLLVIGRDYDYNDKDQVIKTRARSDL